MHCITTDWHIGAKRSAGATPQSNAELTRYMLSSLESALDPARPHLIAGDLFDAFTIDTATLFETYHILDRFLATGQDLAVMRGNHDFSERGSQRSSFDLVMGILEHQYPDNLTVAREVTAWHHFVLVPHLPNNEILKLEVEKLSDVHHSVVVFHANFDNPFAANSEHSLNVTPAMVEPLIERGNVVVFGHEHVHRLLYNGMLLVLGNAVPASISDCLSGEAKYAAIFDGLEYVLHPRVVLNDVFQRVDWRDTGSANPMAKFIRVEGEATSDEAATVVNAVSALRKRHDAYVISNAVAIGGIQEFDELTSVSFEDVSKVDVLGLICEDLTDREAKVVRGLLS
jgi:DNA repair exonuclease SbcCD nuclease subunit